jgi:WhiB family redox-sensing transcriptional regulator
MLVTWRDGATCLDEDPELFFPIGNSVPAILQKERAKVVCRRCQVVEARLSWAMESRHHTGAWGRLSEDERGALKRPVARFVGLGQVLGLAGSRRPPPRQPSTSRHDQGGWATPGRETPTSPYQSSV